MKILITGGAGYLGGAAALQLLESGHHVRVVDDLLFGAAGIQALVGHPRFTFVRQNLLNVLRWSDLLGDVDAVVHLAAIVGDPACARDPELARRVNVDGSRAVFEASLSHGVKRFVFASTCSNYGRMKDTATLATEEHELRPVSLYAETKVQVERELLSSSLTGMSATVLRFATLYGLAPRMRFDLTVNEFVMRMLTERRLTIFGEQFWRPYVHVRDAARAIDNVLGQPTPAVASRVFNVGSTTENYTKADLVQLIQARVGTSEIHRVYKAEDPRDYRVSFERIQAELHFTPLRVVSDGIGEIASAMEAGLLNNPTHWTYYNTPNVSEPPAMAHAVTT